MTKEELLYSRLNGTCVSFAMPVFAVQLHEMQRIFMLVHANNDKAWLGQVGIGNPDSEQMVRAIFTIAGCAKAVMSLSHAQMMWIVWRM